jgi:hypothetical protein
MLCWIDTHELPLGSIPPVAPALAISSAGLAPNAAEDNTLTRAITATATIARSARPKWRFDLKRRDGIPEMVLIGVFSFDNGRSRRIIFDVFISLESSFLFSRKLVPIFRPHTAISQHATARFTAPTS